MPLADREGPGRDPRLATLATGPDRSANVAHPIADRSSPVRVPPPRV